ncbi:MAG: hypothetical protein J0647_05280 [Campylobacteraceae bacterium]|nr:hypothetical protein [Campylobacteraceae bacterium]
MKKIEIKKANWKSDELFLGKPSNITTLVIQQGKIILDPSDENFLSTLIKEYVKNHGKKKTITLKLSLVEAFYFGKNANAYMLNHIYKAFFGSKIKKPFNSILHDKEEKEYINIGLFNASSKQVSYLVDILNEMKISLKKLSKNVELALKKRKLCGMMKIC